jgi:hypothetical protein
MTKHLTSFVAFVMVILSVVVSLYSSNLKLEAKSATVLSSPFSKTLIGASSILIQTVRGSGDWIYTRRSTDCGLTWSSWVKDGQMFGSADTLNVNSVIVGIVQIQTVRGAGNWIYTRRSTDNGLTWSSWVKDGQMYTKADTERCYDKSIDSTRLVQTVLGAGNWIYTRNTTDGSTWSNWVKDGQMLSPSDTVAIN